jgi:hypothetical protein
MLSLTMCAILTMTSFLASTPDATSILETVRTRQAQRWETVQNYTLTLSMPDAGGLETPVYYEKLEVDGKTTFRMVPPAAYARAMNERAGFPPPTPEQAEAWAQGLDMTADALAQGGGDMPPMDFRGMTGDMSLFLNAGAVDPGDGKSEAKEAMQGMAEFAQRAKLAGTEQIPAFANGQVRDAYHLVADGLSDVKLDQPKGGAKYTMQKVSLWIDKEDYVPLKLLMEVQVESQGKTTPMTIEKLDLDYKPAGPLLVSRQQVYRLGGMMAGMSEKERKDMEKARKDMEKAKKDLEKLPPDQQAMVMKMMGGQMEKLEKMMQGNDITSITNVVSVAVNEGPPTPYGPGDLTVGGPAAATYPGALTMAGDDGNAELAIAARLPGTAQASIGLVGSGPFPKSGAVAISSASGWVELEGGVKVTIESGTGTITVTQRSATRIAGTFTALLKGKPSTAAGTESVQFSASGSFDSGAPVGPLQAPRGSPIPANLFGKQ